MKHSFFQAFPRLCWYCDMDALHGHCFLPIQLSTILLLNFTLTLIFTNIIIRMFYFFCFLIQLLNFSLVFFSFDLQLCFVLSLQPYTWYNILNRCSSITGASLSDCLRPFPGHLLRESYPSAEIQSVYSKASTPANWVWFHMDFARTHQGPQEKNIFFF